MYVLSLTDLPHASCSESDESSIGATPFKTNLKNIHVAKNISSWILLYYTKNVISLGRLKIGLKWTDILFIFGDDTTDITPTKKKYCHA